MTAKDQELKPIFLNPKDLIPSPRNPTTHDATQIGQLAGLIQTYGFTDPILIGKDKVIIAGHGRQQAAFLIGLKRVPCLDLSHLSETDARAFALAHNRVQQNSGLDTELLNAELAALAEMDIDLRDLGFDANEINLALSDIEPDESENETPDLDEDTVVSKTGDVWLLGKHRLMCGDSTNGDDVAKLLAGVQPHLMVTDPPYGVSYDANWRNEAPGIGWSDSRSLGKVTNDDNAEWSAAYGLFPGDVAYVWHPAGATSMVFFNNLTASGFDVRMQIIWAKPHFPIGRGHYHVQHEPCWYAVRKGTNGHWSGDRKQTTLWHIDNATAFRGKRDHGDEATGHSTQKPVECMRRPIVNNSSPGQAVYEPFSGSGTTIIAAETTGRCCYAMELHPPYVDVAVKRWMTFAGEIATNEATGEPFPFEPEDGDDG